LPAKSLDKLLLQLREKPTLGWLLVLAYSTLVTLPHQPVQDFVAWLVKELGRANVYRIAATVGLLIGAALTWLLVAVLRKKKAGDSAFGLVAKLWLLTFVLIVGTWAILTVNNTELVHYPQYFPTGFLVLVLTGSPIETLAWVTLFAGFDEGFQYAHLHAGWGVPFDFNDIYMDLLGGALGMLMAAVILGPKRQSPSQAGRSWLQNLFRRPGVLVQLGIVIASLILLASGHMALYDEHSDPRHWFVMSRKIPTSFWFFDETWGPRTIHTLSPIEGPLLIVLTIAVYAVLERRFWRQANTATP
jgi:hypothetical protein